MAISDLTKISNAEFWNAARDADVNFANHTSEGTAALFTEHGYESIARTGINVLNEWIGLSVRVAFQKLRAANARNPFEGSGLIEAYDNPMGRYIQRITVNGIKPVSPAYKGLDNYDSVDPFIIKKITADEDFYGKNFDYQALITVQDYQVKEIFLNERGMGEYLAAIMQALDNAYMLQRYTNSLEVINAAINSTQHPLQDTQAIELDSWTATAPTNEELTQLILTLKNLASAIDISAQSDAWNAGKFATATNSSDYVLLMRPGIKNRIGVSLLTGAFNPEQLSLPWEIKEVEHFGGLRPYWVDGDDGDTEKTAYPVYDRLGTQIGFATTDNADAPDLEKDQIAYKDPNENVLAIVAQKGVIFETIQNNYMVRTIYNPRGLYENYWASAPNNSIKYDHKYGLIIITKPE